MKIRNGFVSNSSSSSFLLDKRDPEVQCLLSNIHEDVRTSMKGYSRDTVVVDLDEALYWFKEDVNFFEDYIKELEKTAEAFGDVENAIYVRISDEVQDSLFESDDFKWNYYIIQPNDNNIPRIKEIRASLEERANEKSYDRYLLKDALALSNEAVYER